MDSNLIPKFSFDFLGEYPSLKKAKEDITEPEVGYSFYNKTNGSLYVYTTKWEKCKDKMTERKFQANVIRYMREQGCNVFKYDSTTRGGTIGLPDLFGNFPNGKTFYLELKIPSGRTSKLQEYWVDKLGQTAIAKVFVYSKNWKDEICQLIHENK